MNLTLRGVEEESSRSPSWHELLRDRGERNWELVRNLGEQRRQHLCDHATYVLDDAMHWMESIPRSSLHAIVTDPPYGVLEYQDKDHEKLRAGRGGIWRIPPSFDGAKRKPLPRFTILSRGDLAVLHGFFSAFAHHALKALVPGGHLFIASNPLVSSLTFHAFQNAGFEKRGEIIRLVQTLRGGYKPKGSETDFPEVSVMPRSCWEPWGIFRKPFEGTVAQNLRRWGAGGLRRLPGGEPLKDVVKCSPTRGREKTIAPHPSLKPQRFLRRIVRASLPLGIGLIYDPFAGSASTLAAAGALGYHAIGTDRDLKYLEMGCKAFAALMAIPFEG
jgi:site-specific DNA-methyltransferase (adenine-specific)